MSKSVSKGASGSKKHRKHDRDKKKCDLYRRQGKREINIELKKERIARRLAKRALRRSNTQSNR